MATRRLRFHNRNPHKPLRGWSSVTALQVIGVTGPQAGPTPEPANLSAPSGLRFWGRGSAREVLALNFVFQKSLGKVMIEPNETMSDKCLFGQRPRLASKLYTSAIQVSLNVAKTFLEKKEVSSKNTENKVSLKNTKNGVSSKSIENKDTETNLQSKLWSSSFFKESTGEAGKDTVIAKQDKNNKYCFQDTDNKLSESTEDDGEDDTNDDDDEEDSNPNKHTHAPLELMAEFLRAEMGHDYHLAKKLCQMILIYEPENPEAKEFFSLIEEMLLMEETQNLEEDDQDSEEDSSSESKGENEELSEESSRECEDG